MNIRRPEEGVKYYLGELWAIGMVLSAVQHRIDQGYRPPEKGFIFTDSEYAEGCINKHWNSITNQDLVSALHRLLEESPINWTITWVPGHADVAGNEAADRVADEGAKASKRGDCRPWSPSTAPSGSNAHTSSKPAYPSQPFELPMPLEE